MPSVYDHVGSLHRMGNDEQLFQEMVGFLHDDAPLRLQDIQKGVAEANWPRARHAVHSLKGLVSNFGAQRAMIAAIKLEQVIQQRPQSPELGGALEELNAAVGELQRALSPYCASNGSPS